LPNGDEQGAAGSSHDGISRHRVTRQVARWLSTLTWITVSVKAL